MCTIKSNYFYLTNHDDEKRLGAWINTVGFQEIPAGSNYPVSEHPASYLFSVKKGRVLNEYQLVYITDGEGIFIPNLDDPIARRYTLRKVQSSCFIPDSGTPIIRFRKPDGRNISSDSRAISSSI